MGWEWFVMLEAIGPVEGHSINTAQLSELLHAMDGTALGAIHSGGRYALQLRVTAEGPAEAVFVARARWRDTTAKLSLPPWDLVRAEVVTPAEFARECDPDRSGTSLAERAAELAVSAGDAGEELLRSAFYDPVTSLPSAALLCDCLERSLRESGPSGTVCAVLVVGLDGLSAIETSVGRAEADEAVVSVASRLAGTVRGGDLVARLADDQFAVLMRHVTPEAVVAVGERLIEQVRAPVAVGTAAVTPRGSVGGAMTESAPDADVVVHAASEAMEAARESAGDRLHLLTLPD